MPKIHIVKVKIEIESVKTFEHEFNDLLNAIDHFQNVALPFIKKKGKKEIDPERLFFDPETSDIYYVINEEGKENISKFTNHLKALLLIEALLEGEVDDEDLADKIGILKEKLGDLADTLFIISGIGHEKISHLSSGIC